MSGERETVRLIEISKGVDRPVWVVWCGYSDNSGEPEMLAVYDREDAANALKAMIDRTGPAKQVHVSSAPLWPLLLVEAP